AERLLAAAPTPRAYIAAMLPYGAEGERRIARHRALRAGRGFKTIERYTDLEHLALPAGGSALVECLCNLTANEMFEPFGAGDAAEEAVVRGVLSLSEKCQTLIVVTNEVGAGGSDFDESTLRYLRALGRANRRLAQRADAVAELVSGCPVWLKGGERE
ncbi:MAG: bifunctional adenosylcobinamide kinase/adenosylcobinamide-phosphate guanylyltransferase, partial [Clostridia bacterium]|nr:bifunctional adenosylcobinamide kinase/adenosylcobinamide-phosphate guanylyltransferase [Clostridia bacterium]